MKMAWLYYTLTQWLVVMIVMISLDYCIVDVLKKTILSFNYKQVATFGGHENDFMLVVNQHHPSGGSLNTEKILLSMSRLTVSVDNVFQFIA